MRAIVGNFSSEFRSFSSDRMTTKDAWAHYARRRWPVSGVKSAMAEWNLTEGEAKGLFAGSVSFNTVEKIKDHKRGGMRLALLIEQIRFQTALSDFIEAEIQGVANEQQQLADLERGLRQTYSRMRASRPVADRGPGVARAEDRGANRSGRPRG